MCGRMDEVDLTAQAPKGWITPTSAQSQEHALDEFGCSSQCKFAFPDGNVELGFC